MSQGMRSSDADVYVRRYTSRRQQRRAIRNFLLLIMGALALWFFWATRDDWPMARLVPKDPAFQLCATDLLRNRKEIASSRVWDLAPKDSPVAQVRVAMSGNFGLPEWVINNLISGLGLISGADLRDPSNAIFVTHISRIGCVLEKFHTFAGVVDDDPAGGLALRHIKGADAYYAIRGLMLVASKNREALIHALTLHDNEALSPEAFNAVQQAATGRNLLAAVRPAATEALGEQFERVDMTLALKEDAVQLDCKAVPRATFAPALAAIFGPGKPPALQPPVEGLLEFTGDFGRPFTEVWSALLLAFPENGLLQSARKSVEGIAQSAGNKAPLIEKSLNALGTGFSLSWTGIDPLEIVPVPQVIARIDAPQAAGYEVLVRAGLAKEIKTDEAVQKPYFDDAARLAIYPVLGGPTMHPSLAFKDKKIVITSSETLARNFVAGQVPIAAEGAQGNMMLRLRVGPATTAVLEAGQEFADSGFMKGFTSETFAAFAEEWKARAALVNDVTALLAYSNEIMQLRVTMNMAPPAAAATPPPAKGE